MDRPSLSTQKFKRNDLQLGVSCGNRANRSECLSYFGKRQAPVRVINQLSTTRLMPWIWPSGSCRACQWHINESDAGSILDTFHLERNRHRFSQMGCFCNEVLICNRLFNFFVNSNTCGSNGHPLFTHSQFLSVGITNVLLIM